MAILTTLLSSIPLLILIYMVRQLLRLLQTRWRLQRAFREFPGPRPRFLTGNMHELTGDYAGLLKIVELAQTYPGAYPVWMGPTDAQLMAVSASTAKFVLSGSDPKDELSYALMRPWIGDGLLLSKGKRWHRNRRMMTPAFHLEILRNYVPVFSRATAVLADKWRTAGPGSVEVFHHVGLLTLDSMMQCLFGYHSNCQSEKTRHPYIQGVYDVTELIVQRIMNKLHHSDFIYYTFTETGKRFRKACDAIHRHSEAIIRERKGLMGREKQGSRNVDFLDILLTAKDSSGAGLSMREVRDEVDTFMFEGHDSTASTIAWCLYNLARYPDCQDRCRTEVLRVVGTDRDITWSDLSKLGYVYMCIQESMRLYPAVPNISRCLEKDVTLSDGRVILSGTRVAVSLFAVQRDPEVWENPDEFDPMRFTPGNTRSSVSYLPFSIGPRNCIGQQFALTQIRVVIATILLNFRLRLDPGRPAEPQCLLILRSKNGLYLKYEPIK